MPLVSSAQLCFFRFCSGGKNVSGQVEKIGLVWWLETRILVLLALSKTRGLKSWVVFGDRIFYMKWRWKYGVSRQDISHEGDFPSGVHCCNAFDQNAYQWLVCLDVMFLSSTVAQTQLSPHALDVWTSQQLSWSPGMRTRSSHDYNN